MKITNEFTVHTPIERAWAMLTDLPGIAPCMPGAQLTGVDGDSYKGKVKVKVGPVISEFAGTARFTEKDEAGYRAVIDAKGRDARSAGNASALVTAVLTSAGSSTSVSVDTDLKISGKLAQFGSGMIKEVSGKLLAQFVSNLEAKLAAQDAAPPATAAAAAPSAPTPAAPSSPAPSSAAPSSVATPADESDKTVVSDSIPQPTDEGAVPPAPASPAPASPAPATSAPASPAPATSAPATSAPATSAPATSAPATPAPATPAVAAPDSAAAASPLDTVPAAAATVRAASPAATAPAISAPAAFSPDSADETEPLDLLSLAGSSIYKRAIPVVVGVVVVGAVIAWVIARR